jgi:hypothetical protein
MLPTRLKFYIDRFVIVGLILLGLALRLRQYFAWRSLWLDEAMLALNIVQRSFGGLFQTLDYNQGGPVGFLLLEKLVVTLLGNNELTLRLIPLLTGCVSLLLFALLMRQALGKIGVYTALALFAVSSPLIYYASEVKQYSSDVFIALLLLWLAGEGLNHKGARRDTKEHKGSLKSSFLGKNFFLALAGALALWCSHPALFVLAGIGGTFLLQSILQKENRAQVQETLLMIATWIASFAVLYFVSLRGLAANTYLLSYWSEYFMPLPPWNNWAWFPSTLRAVVEFPIGLTVWWPFPAALMLLGLVALLWHKPKFGALLGLTLLAALTVSGLGKYPFIGRLILFSAPLFLALIGAGVETLSRWIQRPKWLGTVVGLTLAAALLYAPLTDAAQNFVNPKYPEHIRPAMAYLRENRKSSDSIYVYYWAVPAFRYYAPLYGFTANDFTAGNDYETNPPGLPTETDQFKGQKRVWFVFSHVYEKDGYNEKDALLAHLNEIGDKKREFRAPGTSVSLYLYDLGE